MAAELDPINSYFRRFYPDDFDTNWETDSCGGGYFRRYQGPRSSTIFPAIVCADGFTMSVQGHFGAYSWPRDDFADRDGYSQVEVMCLAEPALAGDGEDRSYEVGDERIYPYTPISRVLAAIEKHGGCEALAKAEDGR